jgi:hypothetical protein
MRRRLLVLQLLLQGFLAVSCAPPQLLQQSPLCTTTLPAGFGQHHKP